MIISLKKIHHLIRYFILLGILVFVGYIKRWQDDVFLVLIGPVLFLAHSLQQLITSRLPIPQTEVINYFGFLMPVCIFYFGILGFQLKQLWNERGKIRILSLFALIVFLVYIHFAAWKNLSAYFKPLAPPIASSAAPLNDSLNEAPVSDGTLGSDQGQTPPVV